MKRRRGFTLIECLAAMLLVAIVLPVALQAANLAMQSSDTSRHRLEASQLGEAKLNEMLLTGSATSYGSAGDFGPDWPGYTWTLVTTTGPASTTQLDLTVLWVQRERQQSMTMSLLLNESIGLSTDSGLTGGTEAAP